MLENWSHSVANAIKSHSNSDACARMRPRCGATPRYRSRASRLQPANVQSAAPMPSSRNNSIIIQPAHLSEPPRSPSASLPFQSQTLERRTSRIKVNALHTPISSPQTHIVEPRNRQTMSAILVARSLVWSGCAGIVVSAVNEAFFFPPHEDVVVVQFLKRSRGEECARD